MNAQVPSIEQLQELGLPAPVSYWPQTWGWWLLLGLLILGLLVWAARAWLAWRRNAYRREALARLDALEDLRELPVLLKRVALSMPLAPEELQRVPTLSGADWQAFLQRHGAGQVPADLSRQLAELAYAPPEALGAEQRARLLAQCRTWVEGHHVAA
ncbi:DUF4381 domain-containing protein [Pseudomonas sp. WS 5059]|uniref:DUF4381 domain-containing protein n=1 Tax=unclassified Pseudomonas TaxID=196821 RepID=UPI00147464AC|nr:MULTISPECIES: DUF4381 domain-containing protein [unclassified Pseudomonas]NMX60115.1 DUF4381 domain-containing protein [Pseudomonas sp. WS 5079]NMX66660.1 DUF4381 domain-containing protein [Pseudomonas sp. WS 5111]NMX85517.1 DUF4381 domain-containing protein [Pseudomonas sp. WS 5010]NMY02094.1 DUF4381 domain-containing protein [Pseudomonas sp. WS 5059]NMY26287.1 DUF4381 domain-containing protein [Pseudomonas sp. WS 5021]